MAVGLILAFAPVAAHAKANWIVFKTDAGAVAYEAASVRPTKSGGVTLLTGMYSRTPLEGGGVTYSYLFARRELRTAAFQPPHHPRAPTLRIVSVLYDETQKLVDQAEATDEDWLPVDQNASSWHSSSRCLRDRGPADRRSSPAI